MKYMLYGYDLLTIYFILITPSMYEYINVDDIK
mgnify:CR=1 FL=1